MQNKFIITFLFCLAFSTLLSAEISLTLQNSTIDLKTQTQGFVDIEAKIINNGSCDLRCTYYREAFPGDDYSSKIPGELKANGSIKFLVNIVSPECGSSECIVPVKVVCKEIISEGCSGREYTASQNIVFTNVRINENKKDYIEQKPSPSGEGMGKQQIISTNEKLPFSVTPQMNNIKGLVNGEKSSNTFVLSNNGDCYLSCTYKVQGNYKEELISDNIAPYSKTTANVVFFVPDFCKDRCSIVTHIKCYEKASQFNVNCNPSNVYEADVSFDLVNVVTPAQRIAGFVILGIIGIGALLSLYFGFKFISSRIATTSKAQTEEGKRKLSAIMFTDVKGFSREIGIDEEATLKKLWRYEKVMKQIIKEHDGRVVKTIGDAIMGDFDSAVNAVKAAIAIQNLLKNEDIKIRIGVHLGDVIHKGGDLFGEGVNIANRLESICEPGQIYISEDVYNQIRNKLKIKIEPLGRKPLKNIEVPPKVFKIKID
jgi:class 3 adenylate cyclase